MESNVKVSKAAIQNLIADVRKGIIKSDEFANDSSKGYPYALGYAQGTLKQVISDLSYMIGND